MVELPVTKIIVYSRKYNPDEIALYTSMVSPLRYGVRACLSLYLGFKAPRGRGLQYVLDNFPNAPEVWTQGPDGKQERVR